MRVDLDWTKYNDNPKKCAFYRQLLERVGRRRGVLSAALSLTFPLNQAAPFSQALTVDGRQADRGQAHPLADFGTATPQYFNTIGIPLVRGRFFSDGDAEGAPLVAIVNESLVRHRFGADDPIAQTMAPVIAGLVLGSIGALALSGVLAGLLFEIRPTDPGTFALGIAVLAAVAALACLAPARRASAVSPLEALRQG
jgi:hypothetical protein